MRRRTLAFVAALAVLAFAGIALAEPDCAVSSCTYLPVALMVPSPIPTPVPPPIQTLTIQLSEMKSGYVQDTSKELTNADAAKNYKDPKAALAAFQQQGRETSWLVIYTSTDYPFSDALIVDNQVYRYLTVDGAVQGYSYSFGKAQQDHADYHPFYVSVPCCPSAGLRRTAKEGDYYYDQFFIIVQDGRYVTDVQVLGLSGSISVSRAIQYAQLALDHIAGTPQLMQTSERTPSTPQRSRPPEIYIPRDALAPR